ncbi:hypothetical protein C1O33_11820 [Staphylococcus schleiferi]|uniref:hypothetical protein n=2 Tax=Staphylococcus TaxID=1279 RepID=UPI0013F3E4B9|nr:hypothetical protein [Staphylococcus coagulans]MBT2823098.1 hypothetical protein [Staphylococcus coagulans]NHA37409.1 hypothetical protein [Staphylococcus schleiferi]
MKIKTKKQMNLPQLIEWAWENDVRSRMFIGSGDGIVKFGIGGLVTKLEFIDSDETFKVEVEEEITEETVIPMVLETWEYYDGSLNAGLRYEYSIKEALDDNEFKGITTYAFYMLNDDASLTLIWKDGEMVE